MRSRSTSIASAKRHRHREIATNKSCRLRKEQMMNSNRKTTDPTADSSDLFDLARAERIVVGVDGSKGSVAALHWAADEARLRGVEVHAVMAWQQPGIYGATLPPLGMDPSLGPQIALAAVYEAEVETLGAKVGAASDVVIVCEAVEGHPAETLVHVAEGAELLVVGTRGHGGLVGALLGSVSQHVIAHAACPVVVVPDPSSKRSAKTWLTSFS